MKTLFLAALLALCVQIGLSAAPAEHHASFDPAKGFKPAQRDLTEIFLQIAGSLEDSGSPEGYLRHVASESTRIEALYEKEIGKPRSFRPAYMTDQYIEKLSANWRSLAPKLGLEPLAKDIGDMMRNAILGTRGNGTLIVSILNQHQTRIFDAMAGKGPEVNFDELQNQLVRQLELDKKSVDEEGYEISRRDAISFALGIQGVTFKLFKRLDQSLPSADAARLKRAITSVFIDVGLMAQTELELGIFEWGLKGESNSLAAPSAIGPILQK